MHITKRQKQDLNQIGFFENSTGDFVCGILGLESKVKASSDKLFLITSAANSCSVAAFPSFNALADEILRKQESCNSFEYVKKLSDRSYCVCSAYEYVQAKKKKSTSRQATDNLLRVKSSNVWAYGYNIEQDADVGDLYVQFKNKKGGAGDIYQYLSVPLKTWMKFITAPSKGHYFWKAIRSKYKYRKLTGDKKGKLPNAVNSLW